MKIYIIDCNRISRLELSSLVEQEKLGNVAGMSSGWNEACMNIAGIGPDVILADMPQLGAKNLACVRKIREILPGVPVIVLSQAHDGESVRKAYEYGIAFLLHKPANRTELCNVLRSIEMARTMQQLLKRAFDEVGSRMEHSSEDESGRGQDSDPDSSQAIRHLKGILQEIGICNEAGSRDIIYMITYLLEHNMDFCDVTIRELCIQTNQNPKSVEQRIRRAAAEGLHNLASRGMDDYADPVFNEYGRRLYSFEQMKQEMNYIRGKSEKHGNVRIKNFLGGLLECCKES